MSSASAPDALIINTQSRASLATRISVGELEGLVGYALRRAQLAVFTDLISVLQAFGLRPVTFGVLTVIATSPGASPSAVAEVLQIQRANFVPLVSDLEVRGLVRRTSSLSDRRSHGLYITEEGRRLLRRARRAVFEHERRMTIGLSAAERRKLLELLGSIGESRAGAV